MLKTGRFKWWPGTESNRRRQPFQGCWINHLQSGTLWFHSLTGGRFGLHLDPNPVAAKFGLHADSTTRAFWLLLRARSYLPN
jgi:hypothetical protein